MWFKYDFYGVFLTSRRIITHIDVGYGVNTIESNNCGLGLSAILENILPNRTSELKVRMHECKIRMRMNSLDNSLNSSC